MPLRLAPQRSKFGNVRTIVDGRSFASKKEARRYEALKLLERAGEIVGLSLQPRFPLIVNGVKVCTYVGDFRYSERGKSVIEDSKGFETPEFKIKRNLMLACYGIEVRLS